MKKILSIVAAALMLGACSSDEGSNQQGGNETQSAANNASGRLTVSSAPQPDGSRQSEGTSRNTAAGQKQGGSGLPAVPTMNINAQAWALMDYQTGNVVSAHNMHARRKPASLAKIMTAYVVAEAIENGAIKMDEQVPVSEKAWKTGGSQMFIKPGDKVTVRQLLKGMIIQSGNDAAVALAEFVAGSEQSFTMVMNQTAQRLGLQDTHFANPDGLPKPDQWTSAYDMAELSRAFIHDFPEVYKMFAEDSYTWNGITQANRNKLLQVNPHVDGLKTGYTRKAGYNLVASSKKDDKRFISAVLGTSSAQARVQESNKLLTYGARFYTNEQVLQADQTVGRVKVTGSHKLGRTVTVATGSKPVVLTIPKAYVKHLKTRPQLPQSVAAPVNKGDKVGSIKVQAGPETLYQAPVYATESVKRAGFFTRTVNTVKSWF